MNAEFSFQPGPIFETNSPLDFNIFHPVVGRFGTLLQGKPDAKTHEVDKYSKRHILLKPRKLTEPNTEDNTNPREQWDGKTIEGDKLPVQQVGRQKYPTPGGKFVSKTSFFIIHVKFTHAVVVTANKFRTHATS
jgi:hypothetical protein